MRDQSKSYGFAARLSIVLAGLLFGFIVLGVFLVDARQRHGEAIETAKKDTLNYAEILAEHTRLTFNSFDNALREAASIRENDIRGLYPTPEAVRWALHHLVQTSPAMVAIGWTDAQGNLKAHSYDSVPPRTNISEMSHFIAQRDHDD